MREAFRAMRAVRAEARTGINVLRPFIRGVANAARTAIQRLTLSKISLQGGRRLCSSLCEHIQQYTGVPEGCYSPLVGVMIPDDLVRVGVTWGSLHTRSEFHQTLQNLVEMEANLRQRLLNVMVRGHTRLEELSTLEARLQW